MARRRNGRESGYGYPSPYNETGTGDGPDVTGLGIYFDGWAEIDKFHLLQTGPMTLTANSESGTGVFGNPAPGEPRGDNPRKGD